MNADLRGIMFVKADRINQRIESEITKLEKTKRPTKKDFKFILKNVQAIVSQELTDKGQERGD